MHDGNLVQGAGHVDDTYSSLRPAQELQAKEGHGEYSNEESDPIDVPLPDDAYGAAIFAFIYDARELLSGRDHDAKPFWLNMYRLSYVMAVLLVNYLFQFLMLFWIFDFVVQPSVHSVQKVYQQFHAEFFTDDGQFVVERWDERQTKRDLRYKDQLCHMVFSNFTFLAFVLMLWVMIMVIETRKNMKLMMDLFRVPTCPNSHPELMIKSSGGGFDDTEADDDSILIVGLTPFVRTVVILVIVLPKFIIGFSLTMMGMIWLSATESFSELILNSLALEFVISIDDHLFLALLPESYIKDMAKVKMQIPNNSHSLEEEVALDWQFWKTSTSFFIWIPTFVFTYIKCLQFLPMLGVLPYFKNDIAEACSPYLHVHKQRICQSGFVSGCFQYGGYVSTPDGG